jgi:predicted permease
VAIRSLWRRPGFTTVCVLTLGLAIGVNAAMFGVVDAVLLRALPYAGGDRIVLVSELHAERLRDLGWSSIPNMLDWKATARSFESMGVFRGRSMALTGEGDPAYVYGSLVTAGFFAVFATEAALGRVLEEADEAGGGAPVAVIGHGLWQRRFGGARDVLGRTLIVDGVGRTIVGVMPAGYTAPNEWIGAGFPLDVWIPLQPEATESRGNRSFNVVGRLESGVTLEAASVEMTQLGDNLARQYPDANRGWTIRLDSWKETVVGGTRGVLFLVAAAMALVLVVACANVGNLLLNRSLTRRSEFALRSALGAGAARVARSAVAEALLLSLAGGMAGVFLASALLHAVIAFEPGELPRLVDARVGGRVLLLSLAVSVFVGLVVGSIPALHARRTRTSAIVTASGRMVGSGRGSRRLRDGMAIAQLCLALALLAGSAMVARAFLRMRDVSPGFEAENVLTATVALSWARVVTIEQRADFVTRVLERLDGLPGVESAAMINSLPFSGSHSQQTFSIEGVPIDGEQAPFAAIRAVSPSYFETMRIPLRGRSFGATDLSFPPAVALVNESFVRQYVRGREAFGVRLLLQQGALPVEIVGVVGDVLHYGLTEPARPEIYLPLTADYLTSKTFVVRTNGQPYALSASVRQAIHEVDPDQPLRAVERGLGSASTVSMGDMIAASVAAPRFHALVLITLAGLAVLLSVIGLFAVVAQVVAERSREIGVRMALGAEQRTVLAWILSWSSRLVLTGIAGGTLLTLAAGRFLEALLFGASTRDPVVLGSAAILFLALATIAAVGPAARATRIDPARVLREER